MSEENVGQETGVKPTPTEYNLEIVAKLIEAFHNDYDVRSACRYAGIHHSTYYDWLKDKEGFADKMEAAQNKLLEKAGEVITKAISEGDQNTAKWYKDRRDPRFKSKVEAVINPEEQDLEDIIKDLTDDPNNLPDDSPRAEAKPADESTPNS